MDKHAHKDISRAELRQFGLLFAGVLAGLFGLLIPFIRHGTAMGLPLMNGTGPDWPWYAAGLVATWALAHPTSLFLLHTPWMKFAGLAQWVNTRLIMWLLFYVIILPTGLLLRLFGKDSMQRKFEQRSASYRVKSEARERDHMDRPF